MGTLAAVGIYDNLASRQPGVTVRTTDYELARGVDVVCDMVVEQCQHLFMMDGGNDTRHQNLDYIPADLGEHFLVGLQLGGITVVGRLTKSSCWVETTMVSMRTGVPFVTYSMVTWLLASGRR